MKADYYRDTSPRLLFEEYFLGPVTATGIFQDRRGRVKRSFVVQMEGRWQGEEFVLEEDFLYNDGVKEHRTWRLRKLDEHRYVGRSDDVVGTASGETYGNTLHRKYDLLLRVDNRTWKVHFDDWMFLQTNGVLINRAKMSKFGIELGEVILFFQRGG